MEFLDRLEAAVRAGLAGNQPKEGAEWLLLSMNLTHKASYRDVDAAATQIVQAVRDAPADLGARSWEAVGDLPEPALSLAEVELRRMPAPEWRISFVNGHEAHDTWIAPRALAFVRRLIASKGSQATDYQEVWILVVDNEVIIDLDNVRDAFAQERDTIPPNWSRVFLIPATDRTAIQSLDLHRDLGR